jgi:hypothetical protein
VVTEHGIEGTCLLAQLNYDLFLGLCVGCEPVQADDYWHAVLQRIADMMLKVSAASGDEFDILLAVLWCQLSAWDDWWPTTVHLQRTDCGDQDRAVRHKPAVPALDIEELLHTDISAKPSLCADIPFRPYKLQRDLVGNHRAVPVSDVCEWSGVDEDWRLLDSLHERWLNGVLHEDGQSAASPKIVCGD